MTALRSSRKKGQMGIMELFMIIFVLFIVIGLGMYYFYKFSIASTKEAAEESCIQSTSEQLSSVLNMPEIKCSIQAHSRECIDVTKVMAFSNDSSIKALSRGACPKSITFLQVYPAPGRGLEDVECTQETWPENCGKWTMFEPDEKVTKGKKTQRILETPVSLYFPTLRQFRIGKLQLKVYQQ